LLFPGEVDKIFFPKISYRSKIRKAKPTPGAVGRGRSMTQDDEAKGKREDSGARQGNEGTFLPPLDVSSLILPFYTQALLKLGLIETPDGSPAEEDLDLAKRMIDLLELFKTRTDGRLEPDEQKFLESILQQLKLHYMDKAKIIRL
jgi:hypothetical protein